ncbi:hypothetical protein D3C71_1506250 [compost metagenome]
MPAGPVGQPHGGQLGVGRNARDHVRQGHVYGHQQHTQFVVGQHHGEVLRGGAVGQDLGVAGIVDAGLVHGLLVQRRGNDGADTAGLRVVDGGAHIVIGRASGGGADLPQRQRVGQGRATGDDMNTPRIGAGLGDVADFHDVQACAQLGSGAAQRACIAVHHTGCVQALRNRLDDDFRADAGGIAHGDAHGQ